MSDHESSPPGLVALAGACLFPGAVIIFEAVTKCCAELSVDPLPTPGHVLLAGLIPVVNALLWHAQRSNRAAGDWLLVAGGASLVVAGGYTVLLLDTMGAAMLVVVAVLMRAFVWPAIILLLPLALLPFAPLFALTYAVRFTNGVLMGYDREIALIASGILLGLAVMLLAYLL